ncbi:MAG: hypothetical protein R3B70_31735 [Polyangiaceae bacterium]
MASPGFSLDDLPSTSGRLDVLLRCVRAAFLVSHGLRRDTVVYLVLLGGPRAPRTVRVDGARVRFLRPDERSLAVTMRKVLAEPVEGPGFVEARPGFAVAEGGLSAVIEDLVSSDAGGGSGAGATAVAGSGAGATAVAGSGAGATAVAGSGAGADAGAGPMSFFVLEEGGPDVREAKLAEGEPVFFLGDHHGFDSETRARLEALGAIPLGLGPVSVHADDAVVLVAHELDRRDAAAGNARRAGEGTAQETESSSPAHQA